MGVGTAQVQLKTGSSNIVSINVHDSNATLYALQGFACSGISLSLSSNSALPDSTVHASVSVMSQLDSWHLYADIIANAVFSNGNSYRLSRYDGLVANTTDTFTIEVYQVGNQYRVRAVANGVGIVNLYWVDLCSGGVIGVGSVVINVYLTEPFFSVDEIVLSMQEQPANLTAVTTITAIDPLHEDRPIFYVVVGLDYQLSSSGENLTMTSADASNYFMVDMTTGELYSVGTQSATRELMDRELVSSVTVYVGATFFEDQAMEFLNSSWPYNETNATGMAVIPILISWIDINDNNPIFTDAKPRLRVLPDFSITQPVYTFSAYDPDMGPFSLLHFSLVQTGDLVSIGNASGSVFLSAAIPTGLYTFEYDAIAVVADSGTPERFTSLPFAFEVYDPSHLAYLDVSLPASAIDLQYWQRHLSGLCKTNVLILPIIVLSSRRRSAT